MFVLESRIVAHRIISDNIFSVLPLEIVKLIKKN